MGLSCGAALLNLRAALTELGIRPAVEVLPDPSRPDLLAVVWLAQAVPRRRSNRRPFSDVAVSSADQHELCAAAQREGGSLHIVAERARRAELGRLSDRAYRLQLADPGFRAELATWTGRAAGEVDGVPATAGGPAPAPGDYWVRRDFTGDRRPVTRAGFEEDPLVAVLTVPGSGPAGDLHAGEVLQRVLLTATVHGLSVSLVSQLIELPEIREQTQRLIGAARPPHAVLRIGHGFAVVTTPRRTLEDLVLPEPDTAPAGSTPDPHDRSRLT